MNKTKTEVIFNNGKNTDNGYLIKNPYADKVRFITDATEEGFIEIPKITVIGLINFLYVGEDTERDGRLGFRSRAVAELNYWFKTKKTYRFWRKALRPMYEQMGTHKHQKEVKKDMDF